MASNKGQSLTTTDLLAFAEMLELAASDYRAVADKMESKQYASLVIQRVPSLKLALAEIAASAAAADDSFKRKLAGLPDYPLDAEVVGDKGVKAAKDHMATRAKRRH